jgi:hypothetical protein
MEGSVTWETLTLLSTVVIFACGTVVAILMWLYGEMRKRDVEHSDLRVEMMKAIAALDKSLSQQIIDSRHNIVAQMQREAVINDSNDEARRKECEALGNRLTRIEARMNGNHPKQQ